MPEKAVGHAEEIDGFDLNATGAAESFVEETPLKVFHVGFEIYGALDFFVDFMPNRLNKVFFKVSISCSSPITRGGRNWQIFSLTSTSSFVTATKRR